MYNVLDGLSALGWTVKAGLRVPHATSPDGRLRLWFRKPTVYYTFGSHLMPFARTTDMRPETATIEQVLYWVARRSG